MWRFVESMGWGSWPGGLWMVILCAGFIAIVVWGITKLVRRDSTATHDVPYDVAKQRYAKGKISRKEFEQIKRELS